MKKRKITPDHKTVRRVLTLTGVQDRLAMYKAKKLGFPSVQAYIMFLLSKDIERVAEEVNVLPDKDVRAVGAGLNDYKTGKYKELTTEESIEKYFEKLSI